MYQRGNDRDQFDKHNREEVELIHYFRRAMYLFKIRAQLICIPFHDLPPRNNFVNANARRLITPQLIITMLSPYVSANGANKAAPIIK